MLICFGASPQYTAPVREALETFDIRAAVRHLMANGGENYPTVDYIQRASLIWSDGGTAALFDVIHSNLDYAEQCFSDADHNNARICLRRAMAAAIPISGVNHQNDISRLVRSLLVQFSSASDLPVPAMAESVWRMVIQSLAAENSATSDD